MNRTKPEIPRLGSINKSDFSYRIVTISDSEASLSRKCPTNNTNSTSILSLAREFLRSKGLPVKAIKLKNRTSVSCENMFYITYDGTRRCIEDPFYVSISDSGLDEDAYNKALKQRIEKNLSNREKFKRDALESLGLNDHSKADALFKLCLESAHQPECDYLDHIDYASPSVEWWYDALWEELVKWSVLLES